MNSRKIAFVILMVALGNVLSFIPIGLSRVGQVGFDLSLVTTFVVAFYGGPFLGFLTGLAGGVTAGIEFGPLGWLSWLGLIGLPVGKSLTGLASGAVYKMGRGNHSSLFSVLAVLVGYVPEFLFTIGFFLVLAPYFLGWTTEQGLGLLSAIAVKAWMEMAVMSVLMGGLVGNTGFNALMTSFFSSQKAK